MNATIGALRDTASRLLPATAIDAVDGYDFR